MDFRLLAYGGTIFAERWRFGSWSVPEGVLADFYGLRGHEISFGLGVTGEEEVTLVFRQRQNLANRGGYPYTLLFDPGIVVWTRFRWSATDLLLALQSDENGLALLSRADEVTREDIQRLVETLAVGCRPLSLQSASTTSLMEILAGSLLHREPLSVSTAQLGYSDRPDAIEIAKDLDIGEDLPVFCRTGLGWLIGGSLGHSAPLGVQIIVDDELPSPTDKVTTCRDAGRRIIAEWRCVRSRYPGQLDPLHLVPPWSWKMGYEDALDRISLAAALLSREIDDARYAEVRRLASDDSFLATEIRDLAYSRIDQDRQIGEQFALFLLDECWRGRLKLNLGPNLLTRCDEHWLEEELLRRGVIPGSFPSGLRSELAFQERLWLRAIGAASREARLGLLRAAVDQLQGVEDYQGLVDAAVPEDLNRTELDYLEALRKGPLKKALRNRLGPGQSRRARKGQVDPSLYVRLVEDDGLRTLYDDLKNQHDPKTTATKLIDWCLENVHLPEAERQLESVATSPFRQLIPFHLKRDIAYGTCEPGSYEGVWGPFRALCDLYDGAEVEPPPVDVPERQRLCREILDLMKDGSGAPNAPALERWLGLPREISEQLQIAWSRHKIANRQSLEPTEPNSITVVDAPAGDLSDISAHELAIKQSLFETGGIEDATRIVRAAGTDGAVREALIAAIRSATALQGSRFSTMFRETELVVAILALLTEDRHTVIKWLADAGKLLDHFGESITTMVSGNGNPPNVEITWAVIDYLRSDSEELEKWAITLRGKNLGPEFVKAINTLKHEESNP